MKDMLIIFRLHKFKVRQFDSSNSMSPRFYFYFDQDLVFVKARIEQIDIGSFDFSSTMPMEEYNFAKMDWYTADCEQIA